MSNIRIDNSARVFGTNRLGNGVYIAQGSVLRSERDSITIGNSTWVLENSVLVGTDKNPLKVGSKTVFGHKCIALGSQIGDLCEIGNGTIFMPGSKIGNMCIFGEGTIVPSNSIIPDESVVIGRPGKVIRNLTKEDMDMISRMRGLDIGLEPYVENIFNNDLEEGGKMGKLYKYGDKYPNISKSAHIYDSAEITGDVMIGENSIVASGVRIIGDSHGPVVIGNNVQILENSVLHLLPNNKLVIEDNVIIGPACIVHGTTIGTNSIIESGSIICDNSYLGSNTLVKSGSLIKQRSSFSDNQIIEGFPGKVIGKNKEIQERPPWSIQR